MAHVKFLQKCLLNFISVIGPVGVHDIFGPHGILYIGLAITVVEGLLPTSL